MRKLTPIVLSGLLFLAACGDDDGGGGGGDLSSAEQEYVDAAMAEFDPEEAEPLTEDDARCVVTSMVETLGTDRLEELGITPETFGSEDGAPFPEGLSEDEANGVVDGFDDCLDLGALFTESMAADDSIDDETKECLADAFDGDVIRRLFVTMLTEGEDALSDDPELLQEFMTILQECPGAMGG
ncbi:MAG: hypothetical protein ACO1PW_07635 [Actinomycetota bacterium]